MPRYFMTWEVDPTRAPVDMKERAVLWSAMLEMVKQQMKEGTTKDWGAFVGEGRGYSVSEQNPVEVATNLQKYYPFVEFEVHQVLTADEMSEVMKSMMK